ncbi:hypothetical protein [Scytonema sp. NUACC26]|uniref:hypothetical protein n=1 Tax=Scytonema sp. NUACC26 TaxID=3140176 RepID=UPI0034DC6236
MLKLSTIAAATPSFGSVQLHQRGARPELLREHAQGIQEWRELYQDKGLKGGRSPSRKSWVQEHFSDLPELEKRYRNAGDYELER